LTPFSLSSLTTLLSFSSVVLSLSLSLTLSDTHSLALSDTRAKRGADEISMDSTAVTTDVAVKTETTPMTTTGTTVNGVVAQQTTDDALVVDNNNTITENNNEIAKKVKYDQKEDHVNNNHHQSARGAPPVVPNPAVKSRVVHVRNIPLDTSEHDLIQLSGGFGRVTNCLILRGKCHVTATVPVPAL
jgi:hypothetical protein